MKRRVESLFLKDAIFAPKMGLGGETTLNSEKQAGIEMFTGEEAGMVTIYHRGYETGVPISNCRNINWAQKELKIAG